MGKSTRWMLRSMGSLAIVSTIAGCGDTFDYRAPAFPFAGSYAAQPSGTPVLMQNPYWWRGFKDPVFDALVQRAMTENIDLEAASARVEEARALVNAVPSAVSLDPSIGASREKSIAGNTRNQAAATFGLSWLLDPYGARRNRVRAARARSEAAEAEFAAARLLVLLNLGNAYVDLRYRQNLLSIANRELRSRRQTLSLTETLQEGGSATRLSLVRAQARLAETESLIPDLRAGVAVEKNRIAVLLGKSPGTLDVNLDGVAGQPQPQLSPKAGIPADLLRNRPDIAAAERLYYASVAQTGVARAELYPQLSLGGSLSLISSEGVSGSEFVFGPTLRLPALPDGSRRASLKAQEARAEEALASWKSTVLDAVLEVENALQTYAGSTATMQGSARSVRLYREAVDLTRELVSQGSATISELLEAEEEVFDAERALAASRRSQASSFVSLNVSLGSGVSVEQGVAGSPEK